MTDLDVGFGVDALAFAWLVAMHFIDIALAVHESGAAPEKHVGRALLAQVHRVGDVVRHGVAIPVRRQAYVRQNGYEHKLPVFGCGGFGGHDGIP